MYSLTMFDQNNMPQANFIKALEHLIKKHEIEISSAEDKFTTIKRLWFFEYNSLLENFGNENYEGLVSFINPIELTKFSLKFN